MHVYILEITIEVFILYNHLDFQHPFPSTPLSIEMLKTVTVLEAFGPHRGRVECGLAQSSKWMCLPHHHGPHRLSKLTRRKKYLIIYKKTLLRLKKNFPYLDSYP